jgi:hypothetical protein
MLAHVVALAASLGASSLPATADSTLIGVVVSHAALKTPLEDAQLRIVGVDSVFRSDYVGEISFKRPRSSKLQLRVSKAGFAPVDTTFEIGNVDWMQIVIALAPAAQPLPATTVLAAKPAAHLADFERRRTQGRGRYITPEQLREAHDQKMIDMLLRLPGLSADAGSDGITRILARSGPTSFVQGGAKTYGTVVRGESPQVQTSKTHRSSDDGTTKPGYCEVSVFMDGVYVKDPDVSMLRATGFDAVEWYTPSNIPPEYKRPGTQCGVLLLWSR